MAGKKNIPPPDSTTEEKIRNAARAVFHRKGFSGTRTRDIAEEAGINLALLNYYFRSKQKLFDLIMQETLTGFLESITQVFNDEATSLEEKIGTIASRYIDLLTVEPDIPLFIMSEIRQNPEQLLKKMKVKQALVNSVLMKQYMQAVQSGKIAPMHPLHFLMNLMGLCVFPFVASPLLKNIGDLKDEAFNHLMIERKALIPTWLKAIMQPPQTIQLIDP